MHSLLNLLRQGFKIRIVAFLQMLPIKEFINHFIQHLNVCDWICENVHSSHIQFVETQNFVIDMKLAEIVTLQFLCNL